jgi:hypothetical protein
MYRTYLFGIDDEGIAIFDLYKYIIILSLHYDVRIKKYIIYIMLNDTDYHIIWQ